ncbi:glycoside hydrolase family 13 protein [Robiginitalea sp. M366]|uniref:glycoside hydrolase family 13 protein n=1 Tax=Robiginitalea aestuariiviva TaxID=3036903 RepID=UPI00240D4FB0|nr:glycoside hydrolase family 13 protein [Robiginitalea aestuariiviva]MDG1571824.1 glycoside hydrolase family 13 protein [Robiginitalea aestuariiviva]
MSGKRGQGRSVLPALLTAVLILSMTLREPLQAQLRVEPPNWWVGMRDNSLQLLVHGPGMASATPTLDYPGVTMEAWHPGASPNYLFIDLQIGEDARPGTLLLTLERSGTPPLEVAYPLQAREKPAAAYTGFDASDVIYLITPDRFANGDPSNDVVPAMREARLDRKDDYGRHGGDIRGMINHLDYMAEMGFTALWPSPLLTNDMPEASYHGYAITDFYQVDPRFGTLEDYRELAREANRRGIKLIMDQVANHCGLYHWWMEDLPFPDWIHYQRAWEEGKPHTVTNHRRTVNQDPYASGVDKDLMNQGWFVPSMPDLNQSNPFMARYLIQNSIWWVETLGLGGIRQDTYPYPNKFFMAEWARALMEEYPNFNIVGEEWSYNPLLVGYWQDGSPNRDGYRSYLRTTMDFPLQRTLVNALNAPEQWDSGLNTLYEGLANDFYYTRPQDILLFGDNHDMDRLYTQLGESDWRTEAALAFILTAPRIPQIYYGTEILMQNTAKPGDHGLIRSEFPGGWPDSKANAFTGKGLSPGARNMQENLKRLLQFRKNSPALTGGSTVHFAPQDGVYVLARKAAGQTVVLLLNKNEKPVSVPLARFGELGLEGLTLTGVLDGSRRIWSETLTLDHPGAYVLVADE